MTIRQVQMLKQLDLSIIIVNWNTKELLRNCLSSVFACVDPLLQFEAIVVDNASEDGSPEMVRDSFPQVELIANDENLGFVKANNIGIRKARGRYVLLLNSDTKIIDGTMREILDYFDKHSDVGVITGKVLNSDGTFQRPFRRFGHPLGIFIRHTFRLMVGFKTPMHKRYLMAHLDENQPAEVDWVTGAYLFIRHDLVENGQVFDANLVMYYEDALLCYSVWQRGFRVMYLPLAPIIHYGGASARPVQARAGFHSFRSSVYFICVTRGALASRIYYHGVIATWKLFAILLRVFAFVPSKRIHDKANLFRELLSYDRQFKE